MRMFRRTAIQAAMNNLTGSLTNPSSPPAAGNSKGYLPGGYPETANIQGLDFSTNATFMPAMYLSSAVNGPVGLSSLTDGYACGGCDSSWIPISTIDRFALATESYLSGMASMPTGRSDAVGTQSSTQGFIMSGTAPGNEYPRSINTVTFATQATGVLGATLSALTQPGAGLSSPTVGYAVSGFGISGTSTVVEKLNFATKAVTPSSYSLSNFVEMASGTASVTKGYVSGGGMAAGYSTTIQGMDFATDAVGNISAVLGTARREVGSLESPSTGYACGGLSSNKIDALTFSSETAVQLGSVLSASLRYRKSGMNSK